jgi:PIN like domain
LKIAFDEHIPPEMVIPVRTILEKKVDVDVVMAKDYAEPPATSDVPWLCKFAAAGGRVVITGDRRMRSRLDEQAALRELGLIVFFFPKAWNHWCMTDKCAFLLKWWPTIIEKAEQSKAREFWEMKLSWTQTGEFRHVGQKKS